MKPTYLLLSSVLFAFWMSLTATAQDFGTTVNHVAGSVPVQGFGQRLSAERPFVRPTAGAEPKALPQGNTWTLLATLPGAVIHDIVFPTAKVGYAAAEGGQVWKTANGGKTWKQVLNLGFPYYFYGIDTLNAKNVVASGFYNSQPVKGFVRWSHDGGKTWSSDIAVDDTGPALRVRFQKRVNGLITDLVGNQQNWAQYTSNGGASSADWHTTVSDPSGAWFGLQFSFLPNLHARASGIDYCQSSDAGADWSCSPSIDPVFDGEVFFLNDDKNGWVGAGEIAPNVEGWVHVSTDGGKTWSGRTLDGPWPIREILFLDASRGWAAGGNIYTGVGGIFFSSDGGNTWSVDADTGSEMDACAAKTAKGTTQVWCAGYDGSFNGHIYSTTTK